jgi:transposase
MFASSLSKEARRMIVEWKTPQDAAQLRELARVEANAKQRDRFRVVLLAGDGGERGEGDRQNKQKLTREQIAVRVGRSRQFVDEWVGRYRSGGIEALWPRKQPGAAPKLTVKEQQQLCDMLEAGPPPEEGLAAYNGPILRQRIEERFGKLYSLPGLYCLLHRLGYNDLMPRTTHPDTDPAVQEQFKKKSCQSD